MPVSPLTKTENVVDLFVQQAVPVFQNKVYNTFEEAVNVLKKEVTLSQCMDTGFVFSSKFDISILEYDEKYQNEQSNSNYFQSHLNSIIDLFKDRDLLNGKILEIGCGKGYFMDMLLSIGADVTGIDPTYEGDSDKVIKDYYSEAYNYLNADLIVLRHTLEHLPQPSEFLQMVAESNDYRGKIYIEIPTFDWIVNNNAIEDIFYEHCNYFTPKTISTIFEDCEVHYLFNKQYIGILADLSTVRKNIKPIIEIEKYNLHFTDKLETYKNIAVGNIAIWGAGAKGSTFLNLIDPDCKKVKCVIDINPKKQNKFIGGTGHPIISPENLQNFDVDTIIVMNHNYFEEIKKITNKNIVTI